MDKPILNPNIHPMTLPDGRVLLFNQQTRKGISIGVNEYELLKLCDGKTRQTDICQAVHCFSAEQSALLLDKFIQLDILTENSKNRRKFWNIKIPLYAPSVYKKKQAGLLIKITCALFLFAAPIFFISGLYIRKTVTTSFVAVHDLNPLWFILIFIISATLHELSHAFMAYRYGAYIVEMGIGCQKLLPCLYTSVMGVNSIERKTSRVLIYSSGVMMNLLLSGLGFLTSFLTKAQFVYSFSEAFANFNILLVVINLVFVFPLDGYFIVREISSDQNLQRNSILFFMLTLTILISKVTFGKVILGKGKDKASRLAYKKELIKNLSVKRKFFYLCFSITEIICLICSFYISVKIFINILDLIYLYFT